MADPKSPLAHKANEESATTKSSSSADTRKRNNNNNHKSWGGNKNNTKKKKQEYTSREKKEIHMRNRRGPNEGWEQLTPHEGSFANPTLQQLFGVSVPEPSLEESLLPKRKVVFLLAYCGTNYGGFQINPAQRTLQAELELALYKANYLSFPNFGYPSKYGWSNSARTDKGVHACAQVCSARIAVGETSMDTIRESINTHLPSDIRVIDVVKVSKSFCAKTQRDRVRYQYMIPSFLLYDRDDLKRLLERVLGPSSSMTEGRKPSDPFTPDEIATLGSSLRQFRATPEQVQCLRDALRLYEGTHSFHSFTSGKTAQDANASRYIIHFQTFAPVMMEGMEWIPTQVLGQSFLLHQIRKMVSVAVDVARGSATPTVLTNALSKQHHLTVSLAPAQGLFLDMSIFEGYNRRKNNDDLERLDWITDATTAAAKRWKAFKEDVVMRHIAQEEIKQGNFIKYLYLQERVFDFESVYNVEKVKDDDAVEK